MAGFGKSLDGSALSGKRPQSLHSLEKKERGQEDTTSPSTAAVSTLQEPFARTAITDQPQASAGGHRGSWGGLLGSAPGAHATYSGPAGSDFAPGTSQSGSPPMSSGVAGRGRGGAGIAAASGRGRGRSHQENATADVGQEEEVSAASSSRRDGASRGRGGGRGGASGGRGRGARSGDQIENLGRSFTQILRHSALEHGLAMRSDGFVLVDDIMQLQKKTRSGRALSSHSIEEVRQAVALDKKGRLELREEEGRLWIRATQGHSIKIIESEALLRPIADASEVPVCVHGTYARYLDSIFREGLKTMNRNHVHFATGLPKEDGVISGMRASCEVLIFLDVEKALRDGMKLWISSNGVILTEGLDGAVTKEYFKEVLTVKGRQSIQIPS